ncbi:MAG: Asp23/Gls24 family envelope stress response protein [Ruminococcaceae bacterium]|nr:Asp23/Gls24 family envelope stress response protein [Oscillospiraceae bacterium]
MDKSFEASKSAGNIKISEEVVATISEIAIKEINGICGTSSSLAGELKQKFVKKSYGKGIKVVFNEKSVTIDVSLVIKFGVRIPEVAWEAQENIKREVESMTGLEVDKINIHITGINVVDENEDENNEIAEENE